MSNKRGHRGEREVSRKTIARGMPGDFRCDRGDYARALFLLRARLRVHRAPGIPCALCFMGERFLQDSDASRRGNAESYLKLEPRHCEERLVRRSSTSDRVRRSSRSEGGSDEAMHCVTVALAADCFAESAALTAEEVRTGTKLGHPS